MLVVVGERRAEPSFPWPGSRAVFVTSLALFIALGVHTQRVLGVVGDEPHYLVIAHSLLVDGDLRIENNHLARHYEAFHPGFLAPHFLQRGVNDVIYLYRTRFPWTHIGAMPPSVAHTPRAPRFGV